MELNSIEVRLLNLERKVGDLAFQAVQAAQQLIGLGQAPWQNPQGQGGGSGIVFKTTSTVPAMSGTTPGYGTATFYSMASGALAATSQAGTLYNLTDKIVATAAYGLAIQAGGVYFVVAVDSCTHLS